MIIDTLDNAEKLNLGTLFDKAFAWLKNPENATETSGFLPPLKGSATSAGLPNRFALAVKAAAFLFKLVEKKPHRAPVHR